MTEERKGRSDLGDMPAYPCDYSRLLPKNNGMSKREHYAVLLLAGFNANPSLPGNLNRYDLIGAAIGQADALIDALARADREDS
jgi:hypothetical protein